MTLTHYIQMYRIEVVTKKPTIKKCSVVTCSHIAFHNNTFISTVPNHCEIDYFAL